MKKALLIASVAIAVAASTTPVKKGQDGTITINTSTLKADEGCFGPTPVIIHLDSLERVSRIEFLPNDETPSYWSVVVDRLSHVRRHVFLRGPHIQRQSWHYLLSGIIKTYTVI